MDTETPVSSEDVVIIDINEFALSKVNDTTKTYHIKVNGGVITGGTGTKRKGFGYSYTDGGGIYNAGSLTLNSGNIMEVFPITQQQWEAVCQMRTHLQ